MIIKKGVKRKIRNLKNGYKKDKMQNKNQVVIKTLVIHFMANPLITPLDPRLVFIGDFTTVTQELQHEQLGE